MYVENVLKMILIIIVKGIEIMKFIKNGQFLVWIRGFY